MLSAAKYGKAHNLIIFQHSFLGAVVKREGRYFHQDP